MVTQGVFRSVVFASLVGFASLSLIGCNQGDQSLTAGGSGGDRDVGGGGSEKPRPDIVEGKRPLLLQRPTHDESKFHNVMRLEFGKNDQAAFSFTFAPEKAGSLYFTNIQSRLHLEGCKKDVKRVVTFNVVWQEELENFPRKRIKDFEPDITEYEFAAGKKYVFTYALVKLKEELADCEAATVRFAVFQKNYAKDAE